MKCRIAAVSPAIAVFSLYVGVAQAGSIVFDGLNMTTNGTANLPGDGNLQLIPDSAGQYGSAYITAPYAISQNTAFTATFSYLMSNSVSQGGGPALADGLAFVLQSEGVSALGAPGSGIGYSGMTPSVAVALRSFVTNDIEIDTNGALGGSPSQSLNLQGGGQNVTDTGTVTVSYNGLGDLTVTGSDSGGDTIQLATTVALSQLGGSAFIGFTGAAGGGSADEEITNFSLSVGASAPEPATALLALPALAILALRRRKTWLKG